MGDKGTVGGDIFRDIPVAIESGIVDVVAMNNCKQTADTACALMTP